MAEWVAVGASGKLATSTDGTTWTLRTSSFSTTWIEGVVWSPTLGLWVAVADTGKLATSPDGTTWTQRTSSFGSTDIYGVAWSPALGLFVAVGDAGKLATSPDGTTWTQRTSSFSTFIMNAAWSPALGLFVAVGTAGKLATSPDGTTWTQRTSSFSTTTINSVTWSPELGLFVAGGNSGLLATSPDGTTWTQRTSSFAGQPVFGVAWSASLGLFVAVGSNATLATSPNGTTWTLRTSGFVTGNIDAVAWSPELAQFVIVGQSGKLFTSTDGINWTTRTSGFGSTEVYRIAWSSPNPVRRTLTARWTVNVRRTLTARWTVNTVRRTLTARWDAQQNVRRDLTARWSVNGVRRDLTARWSVNGVRRDLTARWSVETVRRDLTARWDVNTVRRTLTARWDSSFTSRLTARWAVEVNPPFTLTARWDVRGNVAVYIGGDQVRLSVDSLTIPASLGERTTASFTVLADTGDQFRQGQPVEIFGNDETLLFAGVIERPEERRVGTAADPIFLVTVSCVGWAYRTDKRLAAVSYVEETAGAIVADLLDRYMLEEGLTAGTIDAGPVIPAAVFAYIPVTAALDRLVAAAGGWLWWIGHDRRLHFHDRSSAGAPWEITPADIIDDSVKVSHGSRDYRNREYVPGTDVTSPQTETRLGDGQTQAWTFGYPLDAVPTVTVDAAPKTIGIRGVDTGKDFYWNRGDNTISQETTATPLTNLETLEVTYQGQFHMLVLAEDPSAIAELQAVEDGGSGIVEHLAAADASITSRAAARSAGSAALVQHARFGRTVTFATERSGLAAGQWATVHLAAHGIDGVEMLLTAVELQTHDSEPYWTVTASDGPDRQNWSQFFAPTAEGLDLSSVDASTLILLTTTLEASTWAETTSVDVYACHVPADDLYPSEDLLPC